MKKTLLIATATAVLFLSGCSNSAQPEAAKSTPPAVSKESISAESVQKEIELAEAKYNEIKKMRTIVWRHTKKSIDKAKEHAGKNELEEAHKAAKTALFEMRMAITQHEEALKTWQNATPQALMP